MGMGRREHRGSDRSHDVPTVHELDLHVGARAPRGRPCDRIRPAPHPRHPGGGCGDTDSAADGSGDHGTNVLERTTVRATQSASLPWTEIWLTSPDGPIGATRAFAWTGNTCFSPRSEERRVGK